MFKLLTLNWLLQQARVQFLNSQHAESLWKYMFFMLVSFDTRCKVQVCEITILFESFLKNRVGNCRFQTAPSNRMILYGLVFCTLQNRLSFAGSWLAKNTNTWVAFINICVYGLLYIIYVIYTYIAHNALLLVVSSTRPHAITV